MRSFCASFSCRIGLVLGLALCSPALAEDAPSAAPDEALAARAVGLLRDHCFSCHNPQKRKGELDMTTREKLLAGGADGAVIVPGDPASSRLIAMLLPEAELRMPPKGQLEPDQIQTLRDWIKAGAQWSDGAMKPAGESPRPQTLARLPAEYHPAFALALAPDANRLAAARGAEAIIYFLSPAAAPADTPTTPSLKLTGARDAIQSLAWSPDGATLAVGGFEEILLFDTRTGAERARLTSGLEGRVTALAASADGDTFFSGSGRVTRGGVITAWNAKAQTGAEAPVSWRAHEDALTALIYDKTGNRLVSAGADGLVKFWDPASHELRLKLEGHTGHVLAIALSADGSMIATGGADTQVKIWDTKTGEQKMSILGHPGAINGLAWQADGKALFSSCDDGVTRLLAPDAASPKKAFAAGPDTLYAIAALADGSRVFGACHDGSVPAWNADGALIPDFLR